MSEPDHIHILGTPFHYENIELTTPNGMQGGTYFTKITYNQSPLYVQTPKCETRQGIVVNGKKAHYDIIVAATDTDDAGRSQDEQSGFIEWLERVEDRVIQLLHEKGQLWFTNELSVEDIKTLLTPPVKAYRGGKQLLVRVNVSPSKTNSSQFGCRIFDEQENLSTIEYIKPEHSVISIVEIAGIRFTSRSFQIELVSKQMAVLANTPMFETCLIKKDRPQLHHPVAVAVAAVAVKAAVAAVAVEAAVAESPPLPHLPASVEKGDDNDGMAEIHLDISNAPAAHESISIKNPIEVYYAMYRAAKKRALEAKKIALEAYLDAKNIKNIYNLDLADDDDDDDDEDDDEDDDDEDDDEDDDDEDVDDEDVDGIDDNRFDDSHKVKKKPITIVDSAIVLTIDELK